MTRYLVERTFPGGLKLVADEGGSQAVEGIVSNNAQHGVTWIHSYVSPDKSRTYCIYDGPDPESIRKAAQKNKLPIDRISVVSVLEPYFYR